MDFVVLYERELDVINSEILKRKYTHERFIDINLLGEEKQCNNAIRKSY